MATETSPRRDADGDGDGSTSWPYLLLAPCARRHQPIVAHCPVMPGVVGDVGPLDVVCHGFGSCRGVPVPIWRQEFDHGFELLLL
jgi:hypothetical protein